MSEQVSFPLFSLREFAPLSAILVFRVADSGSPQQDWCRHLAANPLYRRELEEFAVLGDTVIRLADGVEPAPFEKVKILSAEYLVRTLGDETDALEFIRAVKAIASADAGQFELEQIAAHYLGEIRHRGTAEVLGEMGLLGLRMQTVTATIREREIGFAEFETEEQKLTVADQRRIQAAARRHFPLPDPTPNFDDELAAIKHRIRDQKTTRPAYDEFEEFYLSEAGKSLDEIDEGYAAFEQHSQYDENGLIGFSMNDGQRAVVAFDFAAEVDSSYLPDACAELGKLLPLLFVGHKIGAAAVRDARWFVASERDRRSVANINFAKENEQRELPFSDAEFNEWLSLKLDAIYPRRVLRNARRLNMTYAGETVEYAATVEINPDFEEVTYAAEVCRLIWANLKTDFHLRSLRRKAYQELHLGIRKTTDTADLAALKKQAYADFKERNALSLKEFTALNTAARSQEARIANVVSETTRKILRDINTASANRLRFLKYFLYNDSAVKTLTRQEKQRLWDAIREREKTVSPVAAVQRQLVKVTATRG